MIEAKTINNKVLQSFVEKDIGGFMQNCNLEGSSFCPAKLCHRCIYAEQDQEAMMTLFSDNQEFGTHAKLIVDEKNMRSLFMVNDTEVIEVTHEGGIVFVDRSPIQLP
jgi:hypothetical protein